MFSGTYFRVLSLFAKSQALVPTKVAKENATTPLITESVDAEMDQVKDEVEAEDLDTGCWAVSMLGFDWG